ncbi:NAD(P)/FAD-dependent oxidoreductase [Pseudolabrys sp.]|uniref:NAD(P)/FAD-dependent oxidoreductase n=1 Tax=Pseudolabrys sp. TaxID=1960880 RepID=UPI003D095E79
MRDGLLIVGGGYSAIQLAASARQFGYSEKIRIVSCEGELPYQRPPLSKGFLVGSVPEERLALRSEAFYRENDIELMLNTEAIALDVSSSIVGMSDGAQLRYDYLGFATGSRPRQLMVPGAALKGVYYLNSIEDARSLASAIEDAHFIAVIGGGFIGLEVASSAQKLGKEVEVFESQQRILGRVVAPEVAAFVERLHAAKGVNIRKGKIVRKLIGSHGRVTHLECEDGFRTAADIVVVGIGAVPNVEIASAGGVTCTNGIVVDELTRSNIPNILAAGDCTNHFNIHADEWTRLESVQNALDQAKTAAATIAGLNKPYLATPWFWSDQFDCKLQIAGISSGYDSVVIRSRNSSRGEAFIALYFRAGMLIAVDTIDAPADHMAARKLLAKPRSVGKNDLESFDFDIAAYAKK